MSLADEIGLGPDGSQVRETLFREFGISENPFPSSGQTSDHPRMIGSADAAIRQRLKSFNQNSQSQVIVVTGSQGVGKTNLLEFYRKELPKVYADGKGYYVIQYLADPEPRFSGVILKILDELGITLLRNIVLALAGQGGDALLRKNIQTVEFREALSRISKQHSDGEDISQNLQYLSDYLHGVRMLKVHHEALGVRFSLTTQELKTSTLRDLVLIARDLGLLKGILLFMDELEKLGNMTLKNTLGYLSAIRALIDALPHSLFLVLAMTDAARANYQRIFPSLAGRFGSPVSLTPLSNQEDAITLGMFYVEEARKRAKTETPEDNPGNADLVSISEMRVQFDELLRRQITARGNVVQREFLDALHTLAQSRIS